MNLFETQLKNSARFRKVALHVHSPDSWDWAKEDSCDKNLNNKKRLLTPEGKSEFLNKLDRNFDLVAITDHMKCQYACDLSKLTKTRAGVKILPGMEVNFKGEAALGNLRIHFIVIFPQDTSVEKIGRIFSQISNFKDESQRTGNEEVDGNDIPLKSWVESVHTQNGICIAAHIDVNGIRSRFRQTAKDTILLVQDSISAAEGKKISESANKYLIDSGVDAIEVTKPTDKIHYTWEDADKKYSIPVILSFDSHDIESLSNENKKSFVKLTNLSLDGLKDAFKFPDTRIRFASDLQAPCCPYVLGIEIEGAKGVSFFPSMKLGFTENLNCLIGPRGSGKSTIIEAFRYVFGYNRTLNKIDEELKKKIIDLQERNFKDCIIKIYYKLNDEQIHILQATYDKKSDYVTKVSDTALKDVYVDDIEKSGNYPLRLFGWSEIENLGREHKRQRDLLDRLIPDIAPKIEARKEIIQKLAENRKAIEKIGTELDSIHKKNGGVVQKYKEYKEDFKRFNTPEIKKLFGELDLCSSKASVYERLLKNAKDILNKLKTIGRPDFTKGLDDILSDESEGVREWWKEEKKALNTSDFEDEVNEILDKGIRKIESLAKALDDKIISIKVQITQINNDIKTKIGGEAQQQIKIDHRDESDRRLKQAGQIRSNYIEKKKELTGLIKDRKKITDELQSNIDSITALRARSNQELVDKLNKFKVPDLNISIDFKAGQDKDSFCNFLVGFLSGTPAKYKLKKYPEIIAYHSDPIKFSFALLDKDLSNIIDKEISIEERKFMMDADYAAKLIELKSPVIHEESSDLDIIEIDKLLPILEIQEILWDDYIAILLNGRPVANLSPGQRSSAMLPLIALAEKAPLIIDQPEDNLDNKLVGRILSNILAELKEKRQLIIATHNPNILVSGDSEHVVVLDAINDKEGEVKNQASIDDKDVIKSVIDIMEGGKQAFEAREIKYELTIKS